MTILKFTFTAVLLAVLGLLPVRLLHAELLVHESFDYPAGDFIHGKSGGTGWGTLSTRNWSDDLDGATAPEGDVVHTTGLGAPGLFSAGNALFSTSTATHLSQASRRHNTLPAPNGTSYWVSFLMQLQTIPESGALGEQSGFIDFRAGASGGSLSVGLFMEQTRLGFQDGGGTMGMTLSNTTVQVGQTYHLVLRIDFKQPNDPFSEDPTTSQFNETVTLWIDPTPGAVTPSDASGFQSSNINIHDGTSSQLQRMTLLTRGNGWGWLFDEIRIGTTFGDVSPVPEPHGILLVALGGLLLFRRRRA